MKQINGWWCPDILSGPGKYVAKAAVLDQILENVPGRRRVVQAGGHIGVYPRLLSRRFAQVEWFEPVSENYEAAALNAPGTIGHCAALGAENGSVRFAVKQKSTATHHVSPEGRKVEQVSIDSLGRTDVDAILLDVEGYEMPALRGAEQTIRATHPALVVEVNRYLERYGFSQRDLASLMKNFGYDYVATFDQDQVWVYGR